MSTPCIAVATDFSARADRAIDRALQLSRDSAACLCVIHALDVMDAEKADWSALDAKMRECVGSDQRAGAIEFLYPEGSPPIAIAKACDQKDAELIVVGPARYNTLGDFFLGTAVDYLLRHTTRPVLVVKNRVRAPYDQIIAGTDFSTSSAHAVVEASRMFADLPVHLVHAWEVPFKALQQDSYVVDETQQGEAAKMASFHQALSESEPALKAATTELMQGNVVHAIRSRVDSNPNALVVLGSHGTSGWRQAAIGSSTSDLLRFIDADMLIVNTKGAK